MFRRTPNPTCGSSQVSWQMGWHSGEDSYTDVGEGRPIRARCDAGRTPGYRCYSTAATRASTGGLPRESGRRLSHAPNAHRRDGQRRLHCGQMTDWRVGSAERFCGCLAPEAVSVPGQLGGRRHDGLCGRLELGDLARHRMQPR
jgi:hypothetical protein